MSAAGTPFASSRWTSMDSSVVLPACRAPVTTTTYGLSIQPASVSSSRRGSHECSNGRPVRHGLRMLKISMFIADTSSTWCKHSIARPNDKPSRHLGRPNDEPSRHLVGCSPTGAVGGSVGVGRYVIRCSLGIRWYMFPVRTGFPQGGNDKQVVVPAKAGTFRVRPGPTDVHD